jgi:osmotically-inducible protein OsmY
VNKEVVAMNRKVTAVALMLVLFTMACGSMNRATPKAWDDKTIEADVRGKIAEAIPSKTFAVEVEVHGQTVTLSGHAASASDRDKIGDAARSVNGVKSVINNITIQP